MDPIAFAIALVLVGVPLFLSWTRRLYLLVALAVMVIGLQLLFSGLAAGLWFILFGAAMLFSSLLFILST